MNYRTEQLPFWAHLMHTEFAGGKTVRVFPEKYIQLNMLGFHETNDLMYRQITLRTTEHKAIMQIYERR